jgi:hypothetical protein
MCCHATNTTSFFSVLIGPNPTLVSPGAIRRKSRPMKELSEDLFHN